MGSARDVHSAAGPAGAGEPDGAKDFALVWHGYDPYQVNRYIDYLTGRLDVAMAELDDVAALQQQLAMAHREIERLRAITRHIPSSATVGERITEIISLAERQAAELRAQAERDAQRIREEAEKEAQEIRARAHAG